ncbi:hypothetical protein MOQ72_30880 [Saccharopolyspora sp. K220]|uniref:hypothetical protein n=1 Tax=Saccharopolyspora soli TaxID=2926618 RepID=UPI001F5A1BF2|nr:hypothetical protein [Saccharopolyspora soli]MCI2421849.1 hypothetical protein [Saccharopolyspora soli]
MHVWLRSGLFFLTFVHTAVGFWTLLFPRSFYEDVPTVDAYPPFNEHLFRDYGAMNLAMAVVLGASAVILERILVYVALTSNLVWAVSHLVFHATHLPHAAAAVLVVALSITAAIPAVLLTFSRGGAWSAGARRQPSRR